jgi:DNA-binding response OmpR family regulator
MVEKQPDNSHEPDYGHINIGLLEPDDIKQSSSSSSSSSNTQHKRILVVDDNSDIAFTLRIGLEDSDKTMQVYSYDNPVNALLDFKPNFYDLLLIDVNMPLMDGFELCQKMLKKDINVKVCFMTSGEINMDAVREVHPLKSIGCFIKKPITASELVGRIRAELE